MRDNLVVHGIILFQSAVGENDKRFVILTRERGKITVFARGARRPGNQAMALGPFAVGEFEVYEGREAYNLVKSAIKNYFRELASDPGKAYYGFYFLEFAAYYAVENADETELINLLYVTLRAIERDRMDINLIRRIFELKVLAIEGEYPNVFECASCGSKDNLNAFSFKRRGLVCDKCRSDDDMTDVSGSCIYTMHYVITADTAQIYAFSITDEVKKQFMYIVAKYLNMYVTHDFKSLEVLESIGLK
ncbi:MAG: DNA repair protein RecO [Lachnospiraceae bacterium]|nr:DNA repair protein RecO [Lachnospiraceae bacterium]